MAKARDNSLVICLTEKNGTFILMCQNVIDDVIASKKEPSLVLQKVIKRDDNHWANKEKSIHPFRRTIPPLETLIYERYGSSHTNFQFGRRAILGIWANKGCPKVEVPEAVGWRGRGQNQPGIRPGKLESGQASAPGIGYLDLWWNSQRIEDKRLALFHRAINYILRESK